MLDVLYNREEEGLLIVVGVRLLKDLEVVFAVPFPRDLLVYSLDLVVRGKRLWLL